jgi:hypothetical protein
LICVTPNIKWTSVSLAAGKSNIFVIAHKFCHF